MAPAQAACAWSYILNGARKSNSKRLFKVHYLMLVRACSVSDLILL
jgi:hypothetical protein